ncbi:ABC transporter permease [Bradyrhizobium elkanii]|uniref:ABC transporter permease n=1 Tax=Bradyrhizobium elkanii TaxID=29448 RepID=UPI0020A1A667|nr:ABC transporter permease [Bradyrhizobium elkanii]MCP1967044.1 NitT/TauT family transport system permease protein [Bradyrhizobium elkanii]MCS3523213.1 NitT/TauT family transport system permease protein [Bradyrhizobium elkanii]MCS4070868.1 NitT/TauT family transport system permease protein [Bradyrhizobium elkanii]MCS4077499.1 NitT/TauT family transport system permease protein [Bradyrhizobium elkanii]MCS4111450.1 NitT/TauT family transport system permease protein [Bradyrhizobium elkanii]
MSSLEMLTLLELAHGRRDEHAPAARSPLVSAVRAATRGLAAFGRRSLLLIALLAIWEAAPRLGLIDAVFLPPFSDVIAAGWQLAQTGELYDDASASLLRALSGFLVSVVLFVPLGLAVGWYTRLGDLLNQFIEICRNTAPLALLPVFILLLGIGELSKVTMVVYSCAWPLLLNTIAAVKQVDPLLIKSARTMGATPQQLFRKVILPAALPTIFVGIRLASASAMLVLVASEMVGAKAGLGYLIINSQYSFLIPQMYFGIIGITVIGLGFNAVLEALERRLMRWKAQVAA